MRRFTWSVCVSGNATEISRGSGGITLAWVVVTRDDLHVTFPLVCAGGTPETSLHRRSAAMVFPFASRPPPPPPPRDATMGLAIAGFVVSLVAVLISIAAFVISIVALAQQGPQRRLPEGEPDRVEKKKTE